jgi:uncharacterized protein YkwD
VSIAALTASAAALPAAARGDSGGCAHASAAAGQVALAAAARSLRCIINAERARHGLPGVRANRRLRRAARRHALEMARADFFGHVSPAGSTAESRIRDAGYLRGARRWSIGEALVWGATSAGAPRRLVRRLLDSPPHRAILLSPAFRDVGVGVAAGAPDRPGGPPSLTVALDFGRRA